MHNSTTDTYSLCLCCQLSVYQLHPASALLSFSFKCRQHSRLPSFICLSVDSLFFYLKHSLCSSLIFGLCPLSVCLCPLSSYLIFVCSLQVSFLTVPYRRTFWVISNHYCHLSFKQRCVLSVALYQDSKCKISDCTSACVCVLQYFREMGLPMRHHCLLVTGQTQHFHREWWLSHSLFFSISSRLRPCNADKQQFPLDDRLFSCVRLKTSLVSSHWLWTRIKNNEVI